MRTAAVKKAQKAYVERLKKRGIKITKDFILKCHLVHDKDVIKQLEKQSNKNGYIKSLIREDIKKN